MTDQVRHKQALLPRVKRVVETEGRIEPTYLIEVKNAAGEVVADESVASPTARARWFAAAAVLLGMLTVLAVALAKRDAAGGGARDEAQGVDPREITRIEQIADLPVDIKAVQLRNLEDDAVAALVRRCPQLEFLCVHASTWGWRQDDLPTQSITDAALASIAQLRSLRRLDLVGVELVRGPGLRQLEALPQLERLALNYLDLDDAALAFLGRLPSLRHLEIRFNQAMGDAAFAAIGECTGLRTFVLHGGRGVQEGSLRPLAKLSYLEVLKLDGVASTGRGLGTPTTQARFPRPDPLPPNGGGVTVAALQTWPRLRELSLERALELEPNVGMFLLDNCKALRKVSLRDCAKIDDATVETLAHLPALTTLVLGDNPRVTARVVPLLASVPTLEHVDFGAMPWLTLAHVEQLMAAGKDVECANDAPAFAPALAQLRARYRDRFAPNRPRVVRTIAEIEALPLATTDIDLRGLGDAAAATLARFPGLRRVEVTRDDSEPFTAKGLRLVAALPALECLALNNLPRLEPDALAVLGACTTLRSLDVVGCAVSDSALAVLPQLRALESLALRGVKTFGDEGAKAIAKCAGLRSLDLSRCDQMSRDAIAALGALTTLEQLMLSELPKLRDSALMGLQGLTRLRTLKLDGGHFTSKALQALADMRELRSLDLSGNDELVPSALASVPVGVTELQLDDCPGLEAEVAPLLRDRFPGLRVLSIANGRMPVRNGAFHDWLDDAALAVILQCPRLEELCVRDRQRVTPDAWRLLRDARSLRRLHAIRSRCLSNETAVELATARPDLVIERAVW